MRKTTYTLMMMITFSFISFNAHAVEINGGSDCGEYISDKNSDVREMQMLWLIGFMSGLAYATDKDVLKNTSSKSIYLWMDNYCKANPLKPLYQGADELFFELKKQKGLK